MTCPANIPDLARADIYFLPAGNENTASSRLRVFNLSSSLRELGSQVEICQSEPGKFVEGFTNRKNKRNIIVVQKKVSSQIISCIDQAKSKGAFVIYDLDDSGPALWYWVSPRLCYEMLNRADIVTTDTNERANWLFRSSSRLPVHVLPNPIDYSPSQPSKLEPVERSPLRILWFGSQTQLPMLMKYSQALESIQDIEILICTASSGSVSSLSSHPNFKLIPWSLESFIQVLQSCDLSFLMHDGTLFDRQKSSHKMITSICWGVPALVSNTPEYAKVAQEINCRDAVFSNPEGLLSAIERYRSAEKRRQYLDRAQSIIWRQYSPSNTALQFMNIIHDMIDKADASRSHHLQPTLNNFRHRIKTNVLYSLWRWRIAEKNVASLLKKRF